MVDPSDLTDTALVEVFYSTVRLRNSMHADNEDRELCLIVVDDILDEWLRRAEDAS